MIYENLRDSLQILEVKNDHIRAEIQGTDNNTHTLTIRIEPQKKSIQIVPKCTCPFFKSYGNISGCKHLYALTLLWCEEDGELYNPLASSASKAEVHSKPVVKALNDDGPRLVFLLETGDLYDIEPITFNVAVLIEETSTEFEQISFNKLRMQAWSLDEQVYIDSILNLLKHEREFYGDDPVNFSLPDRWISTFLRDVLKEGRVWMTRNIAGSFETIPVQNGLEHPAFMQLKGTMDHDKVKLSVEAVYKNQVMTLPAEMPIYNKGLFLFEDTLYQIAPDNIVEFFEEKTVLEYEAIPLEEAKKLLLGIYTLPDPPLLDFPPELSLQTEKRPLQPLMEFDLNDQYRGRSIGEIFWKYGELAISSGDERNIILDEQNFCLVEREVAKESEFLQELSEDDSFELIWYGRRGNAYGPHEITFPSSKLSAFAQELMEKGWSVLFDHHALSKTEDVHFNIASSGIDWFDVEARLDYGDQKIELPQLLKAIQEGSGFIQLKNGGIGLIPEKVSSSLQLLASFGTTDSTSAKIRFKGAQAIVLDVLVEQLPGIPWQQKQSDLQMRMQKLRSPVPQKAPKGFKGKLRSYQEEGLGWLTYLQELGIQGCLADDMGLGKTVQVLALLELQRMAKAKPSLLVMPKSLVHNWLHETKKFTPKLRVSALTGSNRPKSVAELPKAQVYITTYPLVQRDIHWLKDIDFDYVILDESQAIKNAKTKSAKSCRLLKADHRLTMTGTPVENRLDDLWSQLEFLNPGLFKNLIGKKQGWNEDELTIVSKAVRPFLLRRSKEDVLTDLPEKMEETLFCEMAPKQSKEYDELKLYYQKSLNQTVESKGLNNSKIMVLEALLRLRQAACHPGLIDPEKSNQSCGKLDILLEMLSDILPTGHKALIFSQFTSFLAITKTALDKEGYTYAYLDGKSKDRARQIENFQTSADCNLFLISLKAGGVGLNLTAADYVFILDPWWNPAAEAQAIDRAHRIGQQRNVFAYRIVAENTIEDKILQLQAQKKQLADAILKGENSLLSGLTMEDLNFLLG